MFRNVYVPYKGYLCSPFCRWQGSLQNENSTGLVRQRSCRAIASIQSAPSPTRRRCCAWLRPRWRSPARNGHSLKSWAVSVLT
jgi:hypothetical protein